MAEQDAMEGAGLDDVSIRAEMIGKSAWQLEDTQQDRLVSDYPRDPEARECYFDCANAEVAYRSALFVLLIMSILETPTWCNTGDTVDNFFGFLDPHAQCSIEAPYLDHNGTLTHGKDGKVPDDNVLLSNMIYIPFGWGIVLEVYLISVMARKLLLEWRLQTDYFDKVETVKVESKDFERYAGEYVCVGDKNGKKFRNKKGALIYHDGESWKLSKDEHGQPLFQTSEELTHRQVTFTSMTEKETLKVHKSGVIYFKKSVIYFGLLMVLMEMADCLYFILYRPANRWAFIPRTGYLILLPAVRQLGGCVMQVWGDFASIAAFFVGALAFYAWVVVTIFHELNDEIPWGEGTIKVNKDLDTFPSTFYSMFVAGTTDDFVDKFLPSYSALRWTGLLWLFFLILLQVLLLNLVLDTLVFAYQRYSEEFKEEFAEEKVSGIRSAFGTLMDGCKEEIEDADGSLSKTTFLDWCREFSRSPRCRSIPNKTANYIFNCVNIDRFIKFANRIPLAKPLVVKEFLKEITEEQAKEAQKKFAKEMTEEEAIELAEEHELAGFSWEEEEEESGEESEEEEEPKFKMTFYRECDEKQLKTVKHHSCHCLRKKKKNKFDLHAFVDICSVMQYDFWVTFKWSPVQVYCPDLWNSTRFTWFVRLVEDGIFDQLMNIVLILNLVMVIVETRNDLAHNDNNETPLVEGLELAFSLVYVGEIACKLTVWSWAEYSSLRSNMFDFVTTWLLLATSVVEMCAGSGAQGGGLKRYMNILRLLRLVRMFKGLKRMKTVQFMMNTTAELVIQAQDILTFLGVVVYFFTTLSVQLWGGKLYVGNPLLQESEYKENKFWVLNFNDFLNALGVWVVSLLCEYNPAFPEAVHIISDYKLFDVEISWLVFVIFYIFAVSIVFELVKAFTIEVFMDLKKKQGKEVKRKGLENLQKKVEADKKSALHFRMVGDDSAEDLMLKQLGKMLSEEADESGSEDEG